MIGLMSVWYSTYWISGLRKVDAHLPTHLKEYGTIPFIHYLFYCLCCWLTLLFMCLNYAVLHCHKFYCNVWMKWHIIGTLWWRCCVHWVVALQVYSVSEERKQDQVEVDKQLLSVVRKHPERKYMYSYLTSLFCLKSKEYPHMMVFWATAWHWYYCILLSAENACNRLVY